MYVINAMYVIPFVLSLKMEVVRKINNVSFDLNVK
jgi:hypothetical protein